MEQLPLAEYGIAAGVLILLGYIVIWMTKRFNGKIDRNTDATNRLCVAVEQATTAITESAHEQRSAAREHAAAQRETVTAMERLVEKTERHLERSNP